MIQHNRQKQSLKNSLGEDNQQMLKPSDHDVIIKES